MKYNIKRFNSVASLTTNFNYFQIDKMKKIMTYDIINNNRLYDLLITLKTLRKFHYMIFIFILLKINFFTMMN